MAKIKFAKDPKDAILLVNDVLASIRKYENQNKVLYALLEKQYIGMARDMDMPNIDLESEEQKLSDLKENLALILA